jgi:hypothetical protein
MKVYVRVQGEGKSGLGFREISGAFSVVFCTEDPAAVIEGLEIREEAGALRISARDGVLSVEPVASTVIRVREVKSS